MKDSISLLIINSKINFKIIFNFSIDKSKKLEGVQNSVSTKLKTHHRI